VWIVSFGVIMDVKVRKKFVLGSHMTFLLNVCLGIGSSKFGLRMS
jgi:hypothetical protein